MIKKNSTLGQLVSFKGFLILVILINLSIIVYYSYAQRSFTVPGEYIQSEEEIQSELDYEREDAERQAKYRAGLKAGQD